LVRRQPHATILDVGCGDGSLLAELGQRGIRGRLSGAELSEQALEIARGRLPDATFERLDLNTQTPSGIYDVVVLSEVLEHIEKDEDALGRLSRCARAVVISVPGGPADKVDTQYGHFRNYAGRLLPEKMEKAGFEVVWFRRWGFPFYELVQRTLHLSADASQNLTSGRFGPLQRAVAAVLHAVFFFNLLPFGSQVFAVGRSRVLR
jgi:SAM-dependent methyltransferase